MPIALGDVSLQNVSVCDFTGLKTFTAFDVAMVLAVTSVRAKPPSLVLRVILKFGIAVFANRFDPSSFLAHLVILTLARHLMQISSMQVRPYSKIFWWENSKRIRILKEYCDEVQVAAKSRDFSKAHRMSMIVGQYCSAAGCSTTIMANAPPMYGGHVIPVDGFGNIDAQFFGYSIWPKVLQIVESAIGVYESDRASIVWRVPIIWAWLLGFSLRKLVEGFSHGFLKKLSV